MHVSVVALNQSVSFQTKAVTNYVTLHLPNGQEVQAIVSEEAARALVDFLMAEGAQEPPKHSSSEDAPPMFSPPLEERAPQGGRSPLPINSEGAYIFGGDSGIEDYEDPHSKAWQAPVETSPVPVASSPRPAPVSTLSLLEAAMGKAKNPEEQLKIYAEIKKERARLEKKGPTIGRSVPMTDRGYPIVSGSAGGVDPQTLVDPQGAATDEDGVSSI